MLESNFDQYFGWYVNCLELLKNATHFIIAANYSYLLDRLKSRAQRLGERSPTANECDVSWDQVR